MTSFKTTPKSFPFLFGIFALFFLVGCSSKPSSPPNILFIAIDDLRTGLGVYGNPIVKSPNLDRLAKAGTLFTRHYVVVPTCGASRAALLTGKWPRSKDGTRNNIMARDFASKAEEALPESFVHHLRRNNYYTVGISKITHHPDGLVYGYDEAPSDIKELPHSWDEMLMDVGKWGNGWNAFFGYADGNNRTDQNKEVKPYEAADVEDEGYPDGLSTQLALRKLKELAKKDQPFFMGLGYIKPHLPFAAPKKYWDLYDRAEIPLSPNPYIPENVSTASLHSSNELNQYKLGEEKASLDLPVSDEYAQKLMHGYLACVSYIDAQVGIVLDELEKLDLQDNTIVVVWGDHGWHLGDHRLWGKHTLFERALKSTLMIKVPGQSPSINDRIVSSVDLYPTLMDLAKLDMPIEGDGNSLLPLIQQSSDNWRDRAFSYWRTGFSMRTDQYRLNHFFREEQPTMELFDHQADPYETTNIVEEHSALVQQLLKQMKEGDPGYYSKN